MPRRAEKTTGKGKSSGKLYPLSMRTSLEIRQGLEAAAAKSGRSLAQEVERRVEDSFKLESLNVAERLLVDMHKVIKGFQLQQEKLLEQVLDIRRLLTDAHKMP